MATLTIRNIPGDQHAALRVRAAQHGRSMEEEVRTLIAEAVAKGELSHLPRRDAEILAKADAAAEALRVALREANGGRLPTGVVDALIAERRAEAAREEAEYAQSIADRAKRGAG